MIQGKSVIAIIPARAGSKGLPGKNIKPLCGKPLIAWSIEAGLGSKYIDEVMVTTDSEEIALIAREYGASVPFLRPTTLSSDTATTLDVVKHTLAYYKHRMRKSFDYVVLLEPTSPLRDRVDINSAIEQLIEHKNATAIVGICKTESQNPAFLVKKNKNGTLKSYLNLKRKVLRRQETNDVYYYEGSVYVSQANALLIKNSFYHEGTIGYEVPKWKSLEIDDIDDFIMVEAFMKQKRLI